jgi:hypothetical protein
VCVCVGMACGFGWGAGRQRLVGAGKEHQVCMLIVSADAVDACGWLQQAGSRVCLTDMADMWCNAACADQTACAHMISCLASCGAAPTWNTWCVASCLGAPVLLHGHCKLCWRLHDAEADARGGKAIVQEALLPHIRLLLLCCKLLHKPLTAGQVPACAGDLSLWLALVADVHGLELVHTCRVFGPGDVVR